MGTPVFAQLIPRNGWRVARTSSDGSSCHRLRLCEVGVRRGDTFPVFSGFQRLHSGQSCRGGGADADSYAALPRTAASILATSIFPISIIASNARFATSPPLAIASVRTRGVTCHDRPHLSLHQPHALSAPPLPTMAFQYRSVSA